MLCIEYLYIYIRYTIESLNFFRHGVYNMVWRCFKSASFKITGNSPKKTYADYEACLKIVFDSKFPSKIRKYVVNPRFSTSFYHQMSPEVPQVFRPVVKLGCLSGFNQVELLRN